MTNVNNIVNTHTHTHTLAIKILHTVQSLYDGHNYNILTVIRD